MRRTCVPAVVALLMGLLAGGCRDQVEPAQGAVQNAAKPEPATPAEQRTASAEPTEPAAADASKKSEDELHKGCEHDALADCVELARRLRGRDKPTPADLESAIELLNSTCERGEARGCTELGMSYQDGLGVAQDTQRAAKLYERACNAGAARCCSQLGAL